jgi:hypothetical protein
VEKQWEPERYLNLFKVATGNNKNLEGKLCCGNVMTISTFNV